MSACGPRSLIPRISTCDPPSNHDGPCSSRAGWEPVRQPCAHRGGWALAHVQNGPAFLFRSSSAVTQGVAGTVSHRFTSLCNKPTIRPAHCLPRALLLLVEIEGVRILIDPIWDERVSPTKWAPNYWHGFSERYLGVLSRYFGPLNTTQETANSAGSSATAGLLNPF